MNKKVKQILFLGLFLLFCFLLVKNYLYSSTIQSNKLPPSLVLKDGDIILRKETNQISDIFAKVNNSSYSHSGTIIIQNNKIKVFHIEDNEEISDYKISSIEQFLLYCSDYKIMRAIEKVDSKKLHYEVKKILKLNPSFDFQFNGDKSDNAIYCTELTLMLYNTSIPKPLESKKETYLNFNFIPITLFENQKYFVNIYNPPLTHH